MSALRDQAVLLSGATSGLGRALALRLAAEGCRLALCGRSPAKLASLEAELALPSARLVTRAFDLTDRAASAAFARDALTSLGRVDILINNAGANLGKAPAGDIDLAAFAAMLDLNCTAQLALTQPVWRAMEAAFDGLTGVLRREGKPLGLQVTAVYPGGVDTPFRAQARPDYLRPETVAEAVVGLLRLPAGAAAHELVLRPTVEDNFA